MPCLTEGCPVPQWRLTLTFTAPRLDAGLLAWAIALWSHPEAPKRMTLKFEQVEE